MDYMSPRPFCKTCRNAFLEFKTHYDIIGASNPVLSHQHSSPHTSDGAEYQPIHQRLTASLMPVRSLLCFIPSLWLFTCFLPDREEKGLRTPCHSFIAKGPPNQRVPHEEMWVRGVKDNQLADFSLPLMGFVPLLELMT